LYAIFLKQAKVVELPNQPYSPDLAPCDYFLFPRLKKYLTGRNTKHEKILVQPSSSASKVYPEKTTKMPLKIGSKG
jgi:hypothetical protein